MRCVLLLFVVVSGVAAIAGVIGTKQSVDVRGSLTCNDQRASAVKVKLYDNNMFVDGFMGESKTDMNGNFEVTGYSRSIFSIEPKLNIYHNCGYVGICKMKLVLEIPASFITRGANATQVYNVGEINLATKFKGAQSVDCIN